MEWRLRLSERIMGTTARTLWTGLTYTCSSRFTTLDSFIGHCPIRYSLKGAILHQKSPLDLKFLIWARFLCLFTCNTQAKSWKQQERRRADESVATFRIRLAKRPACSSVSSSCSAVVALGEQLFHSLSPSSSLISSLNPPTNNNVEHDLPVQEKGWWKQEWQSPSFFYRSAHHHCFH